MVKSKFGVYTELLSFESVKTYLNGSIGSKSKSIGKNSNFEQKISNVSLGSYLRGVKIFLENYSDKFNTPYDIIAYYNSIRTDQKAINEFKTLIEDYTVWIKEEFGKSGKTAINYQAQFRGFLTWNGINLKLKNKEEDSLKALEREKYGIEFEELKELSFKIIDYTQDFEIKLYLRFLQITGLGSRELRELTIGDLIHKDFTKDYICINKKRQKTGVRFKTFLYGDLKSDIKKYLDQQASIKGEDGLLFGETNNPLRNYDTFLKRFNTAYKRTINNEYPQFKDASKKLFTMHSYRDIFTTICETLRIPKPVEQLFTAHKQASLNKAYYIPSKLLDFFKEIQENLFGIKTSETRETIIKEFTENLIKAMSNNGKSKTIFKNYGDYTEEQRNNDYTSDIYTNVLVEKLYESFRDRMIEEFNLTK